MGAAPAHRGCLWIPACQAAGYVSRDKVWCYPTCTKYDRPADTIKAKRSLYHECVDECPVGQYYINTNTPADPDYLCKLCTDVIPACTKCTDTAGIITCDICEPGHKLSINKYTCGPLCPTGQALKFDGTNCVNYCYAQDTNRFLRNGICQTACEVTEYIVTTGAGATEERECKLCSAVLENCLSCTTSILCTACIAGVL